MRTSHKGLLTFVAFLVFACQSKQDGVLEGVVAPPNSGAKITAMLADKPVSTVDANAQDGKFRMALAPGNYVISVTTPSAPFPMSFPGIRIEPGKTTTLPLIELAPLAGAAALTGAIAPANSRTRVTLLYEGKERASIAAGPEGKYEFMGLPAGKYTVRADTPGYAGDAADIDLSGEQKTSQNIRLFYISAIDGVDWAAGKIRATGKGLPPSKSPAPSVTHEMAKRAALADAQRNLLKILNQIKVDPDHNLKAFLGEKKYTEKIQGFIQGYRVVNERDLGNGALEVELELPLTGPGGLSRALSD